MPNLSVLVFTWTGPPVVGPGATVLHCQEGDENATITAANTFFNAVKGLMPAGITISAPVSGNVLDELSGHVVGSWSAGASGPTVTTGFNIFVNGVGLRVKWPTIGIVGGRRVVGSTFLVPLSTESYEGAGNLTAATLTTARAAAVAFGTSASAPRIYSRPTSSHGGISFPTLTGDVPDLVSWLRSRRT